MRIKFYLLIVTTFWMHNNLACQSPGGVNGFNIWQKEFGFFNQDEYNSSLFNYHPYRQFDEDGGYHKIKLDEFDKISLYAVFSSEAHNTMGLITSDDKSIAITDSTVISSSVANYKSKMKEPKILYYSEYLGQKSIKQKKELSSFIIGDQYYSDNKFNGGIAEILVYNRVLSKFEKQKISSYLAMKYGISLPDSNAYYSASGKLIYAPNENYKHLVTCIGRDDISGLYQKQSHNVADVYDMEIGLNSLSRMNQDNQSEINNESFLFWSDKEDVTSRSLKGNNNEIKNSWQLTATDESFSGRQMHIRVALPFDKQEAIYLVKQESENEENEEWVPMSFNPEKQAFECKFIFDKDKSKQAFFTFKKLPKENIAIHDNSVYPNPVLEQNEFFVSHSCDKSSSFYCNIYRETGELIKSEKINCLPDTNIYHTKLNEEGAYIVEIVEGEIKTLHKLIVIKK